MPTDRLRAGLARAGVLGVARRGRDLLWALKSAGANRRYLAARPERVPVPPASLRIAVAASADIAWFIEIGRRGAESIRDTLARNGIPLDGATPVLDFGCGCGRVMRHLADLGDAMYGTDLNPALAAWCRRRLGFGHVTSNDLAPPLAFPDCQFGLVYALSVFTHLPESLQAPWMEEMRRVLRPGGHLIVTTHGQRYAAQLSQPDRERFAAGRLVVRDVGRAGSNVCGAYHPEPYMRHELARGFAVVDFVREGASGNPWQDLWLLRRE